MANAKASIPTTPNLIVKANFKEMFAALFDKKGALKKDVLSSMPADQIIAFHAFMSRAASQYSDLAAAAVPLINSIDPAAVGGDNALVGVYDEERKETIGAVWIRTETSVTKSTANAKNRSQVMVALEPAIGDISQVDNLSEQINKDWVTAHPQLGKYTKLSIELQNDALFRDKNTGLLDPSVSILLSEKVSTKRATSFQKAPEPVKTEE